MTSTRIPPRARRQSPVASCRGGFALTIYLTSRRGLSLTRTTTRVGRVGTERERKSRAGARRSQYGQVSSSAGKTAAPPMATGASQRSQASVPTAMQVEPTERRSSSYPEVARASRSSPPGGTNPHPRVNATHGSVGGRDPRPHRARAGVDAAAPAERPSLRSADSHLPRRSGAEPVGPAQVRAFPSALTPHSSWRSPVALLARPCLGGSNDVAVWLLNVLERARAQRWPGRARVCAKGRSRALGGGG
jgi:hypothetical protein